MQITRVMEPNIAESRVIGLARLLSGAFGFLLHVLFFERLASILSSDMFAWATRKTGISAWVIFVGFPVFMAVVWTVKLTWPITAHRQKKLFVAMFLICQVAPAFLGWWIGRAGLWGK